MLFIGIEQIEFLRKEIEMDSDITGKETLSYILEKNDSDIP